MFRTLMEWWQDLLRRPGAAQRRVDELMEAKLPLPIVLRHYERVCDCTPSMNGSDDERRGFVVGFRHYERMASLVGAPVPVAIAEQIVAGAETIPIRGFDQ